MRLGPKSCSPDGDRRSECSAARTLSSPVRSMRQLSSHSRSFLVSKLFSPSPAAIFLHAIIVRRRAVWFRKLLDFSANLESNDEIPWNSCNLEANGWLMEQNRNFSKKIECNLEPNAWERKLNQDWCSWFVKRMKRFLRENELKRHQQNTIK